MKKLLSFFIASVMMTTTFAQSEKYVKAMEALIPGVDAEPKYDELVTLGNSFERIANAEKTQWLPFYYAALANVNAGYTFTMDGGFGDKTASIDPLADKAEELINKAAELSKDNAEIWVVKKMIASLKMMGNPMARFQEYGAKAATALETAKKLNAENPRIYLLEGQDLFFTPAEFGGDKQEAKKRLETAVVKYEAFKPESSIHPVWGLGSAKYFLSQIK